MTRFLIAILIAWLMAPNLARAPTPSREEVLEKRILELVECELIVQRFGLRHKTKWTREFDKKGEKLWKQKTAELGLENSTKLSMNY